MTIEMDSAKRQTAWNVYLGGKWIDCVYFDSDMTAFQVRDSLVDHDGYNPSISIYKEL